MSTFLLAPYTTAWRHRHLVTALAEREIRTTFRGSLLGAAWLVLQPLCTVAVYALVFGGILGLNGGGNGMAFVSSLFAGIVVYQAFSATVARSPRLVVARQNFVTKVAFPLDLLPWPVFALAAINAAISAAMLVALHWALVATPAWTIVFLPLLLVPGLLLGLGFSWLFAAIGVYVRDTQEIVRVCLQLLFFLTPIVWTLDMVQNATIAAIVQLNPLTIFVEAIRWSLRGSDGPGTWSVLCATLAAAGVAAVGHRVFQRLRSGFADVM
jgi:lipopolysaccharide transport system permease protein